MRLWAFALEWALGSQVLANERFISLLKQFRKEANVQQQPILDKKIAYLEEKVLTVPTGISKR